MFRDLRLYRVTDTARVLGAATRGVSRSGLIRPTSPRATLQLTAGVVRWGTSPGVGFALGAARHPSEAAVIDVDDPDRAVVSFIEMDHRCSAVAVSLLDRGIGPGSRVGLLARNSRGFLETLVAVSRTGADLVYLNTSAAPEAIASVIAEQGLSLVFRDQEFASVVPKSIPTISTDEKSGVALLASLPIRRELPTVANQGKHVILTSGTTSGRSRGAGRSSVPLDAAAAVLDAFPIKMRDTMLIAAPLFHAWGWMHHRLATLLDATEVVVRRPEPERVLALIEEYQVETLVTVPVILHRLASLPEDVLRKYDTSSLRCVAVSGSALPGDLAIEFMDTFGDILYNLYGSTEAAFATCADPADLRADPQTAGKPLAGVHIEILDVRGRKVPTDVDGRVYVGSRTTFDGYTDGSDKERTRGLVFTGDIGRLDNEGRLTIVGRADDMVITGGENVHPTEVEEVLLGSSDVDDVAVVGVPDPVYGAALVAHVVPHDPARADEQLLLAWSRDRLGPHHRPRKVVFHEELPRNATGKVLRRALAGDAEATEPDDDELL
ncbi:MAG: AMP-binding protein [Candidatus Nanopelagicales bacterium]|nr:AMP-binding protein [Candidatus Nanopelagicales bacterium]